MNTWTLSFFREPIRHVEGFPGRQPGKIVGQWMLGVLINTNDTGLAIPLVLEIYEDTILWHRYAVIRIPEYPAIQAEIMSRYEGEIQHMLQCSIESGGGPFVNTLIECHIAPKHSFPSNGHFLLSVDESRVYIIF